MSREFRRELRRELEEAERSEAAEPLRERFPRYFAAFSVGVAVAALVGLLWGLSTATTIPDAIAYSWMLTGTGLLLIGGATGGGYNRLPTWAVASRRKARERETGRPSDEDDDDSISERLRRELRPGPNPKAFWQVIGGFAYIGIGVALTQMLQ